jgi:3-oxoacyl-[acyl-carrier protein] reductase
MTTKQVLITGASRGIGAATAVLMGSTGFRVWLHYRSREQAARAVAKTITASGGLEPVLISFDLAQRQDVSAAIRSALEQMGAPDALVLNAGIARSGLFAFTDDAEWDQLINTNVGGFLGVARPIVKAMIRERRGRIVLLSSIAAQRGNPGQVLYAASKGALTAAARSLALELAPRGITVNVVAPGLIETEMLNGIPIGELLPMIPVGRVGKPIEIAHIIRYLCSDEAAYVTGQVISVNGGMWM